MKKLAMIALVPFLSMFVGCASPNAVHHAPAFGDHVGDIICIEDKEHGVLIYKLVRGSGNSQMQVLVKDGSDWHEPEE